MLELRFPMGKHFHASIMGRDDLSPKASRCSLPPNVYATRTAME